MTLVAEEQIRDIEPFDEISFDAGLVEALQQEAQTRQLPPLRLYTPSFRAYESEDAEALRPRPVSGVLGHRRHLCAELRSLPGQILEPMIPPATRPCEHADDTVVQKSKEVQQQINKFTWCASRAILKDRRIIPLLIIVVALAILIPLWPAFGIKFVGGTQIP